MTEAILEARQIKKHFPANHGFLFARSAGCVKAVDGVDFSVYKGETMGLVGESGCGKTTTAKLILLLQTLTSGEILFQGQDVRRLSRGGLREYRTSVQAVFQDPYSSLNPRERVRSIIGEPVEVQRILRRRAVADRVSEVLRYVGLDPAAGDLYPHEFSGGQRQRIAIARALSTSPGLIVLDEPVSGLDVSIRAQIMNLLKELQQKLGVSYLLIAHDLAVVKYMSTAIGVMYLGKIVEYACTREIYSHPLHPYTKALLSAALPSHPDVETEEIVLPGEVPSPLNVPPGCRFHPRCLYAKLLCREAEPSLRDVAGGHLVACHLHNTTGCPHS